MDVQNGFAQCWKTNDPDKSPEYARGGGEVRLSVVVHACVTQYGPVERCRVAAQKPTRKHTKIRLCHNIVLF